MSSPHLLDRAHGITCETIVATVPLIGTGISTGTKLAGRVSWWIAGRKEGPSLVVSTKAGTRVSLHDWIRARAESTPQERPSHGKKVLGGLEQKGSGGDDRASRESHTSDWIAAVGEMTGLRRTSRALWRSDYSGNHPCP